MNIILLSDADRSAGDEFIVRDNRAAHIRDILQLDVGDTLHVGFLNGPLGDAVVTSRDSSSVTLEVTEWRRAAPPLYEIDLIIALPRPQTLKKILFIAGMTGVRRLWLIRANRVEKSYFSSPLLNPEERVRFVYEGMMQGRRTRAPEIRVCPLFREFIDKDFLELESSDTKTALRILPDQDEKRTFGNIAKVSGAARYVIAIGPEGGWVPFEVEQFAALGFAPVTLGPWALRVEHAVMGAVSQIELVRSVER